MLDPKYGQPGTAYTAIGVPWGKLYRKSFLLEKDLLFDPMLRRMQDNIFNMYAFYYANKVKYIDIPLYNYRYEHILGYQDKYDPKNLTTNLNIIRKRKEAMEILELKNDKMLYQAFLVEAFNKLKVIIRYGPLHKKFPGTKSDRKNDIQSIMKLSEVKSLIHEIQVEKPLETRSDKLIFQLIRLKQWGVLDLLWSMKDVAAKRSECK